MKRNLCTLFFAFIGMLDATLLVAQNSAPFWSLAGNSNAESSSKFGTTNNRSLRFYTNNIQRMIINSAEGYIGIGTISPNAKLHINSPASQTPFRVQVEGATKLFVDNEGGVSVGSSLTAPANGLFVSGNTGIGTTSPAVKLQVTGGTDADPAGGGFIVTGSVNQTNLSIDDNEIMARLNGTPASLFLNNNGGDLIFNGTNASGNTGIGTTQPVNKLHVKQSIPNRAIEWQHELQQDNWTVGIGTNTLNCRFEFNGVLRGQISSVDGSYIAGSDLRLKEGVEPLGPLLEKVMLLKPSKYYFKDSRSKAKNKSIGFVAQELEKIFPEMLYDFDGGYKGINYSAFAVVAIKAIQEQEENIKEQQKNLIAQSKIISNLQDRISKMEAAISALTGENSTSLRNVILEQNSPNPFRQNTTFRYQIPVDAQAQLMVYDVSGKLVKNLTAPSSGMVRLSGNELPAGNYIYTLIVNGKPALSKKMVLLK